jgi:hypothetical protein
MGSDGKKMVREFDRIFAPDSLQSSRMLGWDEKKSYTAPKDAMETGTLDDDEAKKIADSTAFRRNLFLSPMSFARKSLSTQTGRSVLNV